MKLIITNRPYPMWVVISSCRDWIAWRTNIVKPNWRIVSSYKICIVPIIMYRWLFLMCSIYIYVYIGGINFFTCCYLVLFIWIKIYGTYSRRKTFIDMPGLLHSTNVPPPYRMLIDRGILLAILVRIPCSVCKFGRSLAFQLA